MGVELFQFAIAEDSRLLKSVIEGELGGHTLQLAGHLIKALRDGECGEEFLDDLTGGASQEEIDALRATYKSIQSHPHYLAICFGDGSRGHDHWAYLIEVATNPPNPDLGHAVVFGTELVHPNATASQGIPLRWSNAQAVSDLNGKLVEIHFDTIRKNFGGFPADRSFYKRRDEGSLDTSLMELGEMFKTFALAAENGLAMVHILD